MKKKILIILIILIPIIIFVGGYLLKPYGNYPSICENPISPAPFGSLAPAQLGFVQPGLVAEWFVAPGAFNMPEEVFIAPDGGMLVFAMGGFLTKVFGRKSAEDENKQFYFIALFLLTTVLVTMSGAETGIWGKLFPFPPEVFGNRLPGSSGLFVDAPQNLLVWGIVYFSLSALLEGVLFYRRLRFTKAP